jgi:hypothetical protein
MNLNKYIYVSPQQYVQVFKEWRYEYVIEGKIHRSQTFKFHQGKDTYRKIELLAWKSKKETRKLSIFDWNRLCRDLYSEGICSRDGKKLQFICPRQKEQFIRQMQLHDVVKVITQHEDGNIVLHHIYQENRRLHGYVAIVGPRGGIRTEQGYSVVDRDGEPCLVKTLKYLFD